MGRTRKQRSLDDVARARGIDPEELIREVAEFRVALDAELTIAAAAVDAGHPDIAADALTGASSELGDWSAGLHQDLSRGPRRRTLVSRTTMGAAVAAGLVGLVAGLALPQLTTSPRRPVVALEPVAQRTLLEQADAHFANLAAAAHRGDATAVVDAARTLQGSISQLVDAAAHGDAAAGQRAAQILLGEQSLMGSVPPGEAAAIIREQQKLTSTLQAALRTTLPLLASGHPALTVTLGPSGHPAVVVAPASTGLLPPASPAESPKPSSAPSSAKPSPAGSTAAQPNPTPPPSAASASSSPDGSGASPVLPAPGVGSDGGLGIYRP